MAAPIAPGRKQFAGYDEKNPYNCEWNNPDPLDDLDDDGNDIRDYNLLDEQFISVFQHLPDDNSTLLAELDRHAPVGRLVLPTPENIRKARDSGVPFGTPPTPYSSRFAKPVTAARYPPPIHDFRYLRSSAPGAAAAAAAGTGAGAGAGRAAAITPYGLPTPANTTPSPLMSFNSRLAQAGIPRPPANPGAPVAVGSPAAVAGVGVGGMAGPPASPRPSSPASSVVSAISISSYYDHPAPPIVPFRPLVPDPRIPRGALLVFDQFDKEGVIHFYAGFWEKLWYIVRLDLLFLIGIDLWVPGASRTEDYAVPDAGSISQAIRHDLFTSISCLGLLAYGAKVLHLVLEPESVLDFYYVLAIIYMLYAFSVCVIVYLGWWAMARAPSPINGFFMREYSVPLQKCAVCEKMAPIEDLLNLHCSNGAYPDLALHFVHEDCLHLDLVDQKQPGRAWLPGRNFSCPKCRYDVHAYVKPMAYPRGAWEESKFLWFVHLFWARRNKYIPDSRAALHCKTIPEELTCKTVQFAELLYRPLLSHFLNVNLVMFWTRSVYLSLFEPVSWAEWFWVVPAMYFIQFVFVKAVAQRLVKDSKDYDPLGFFLSIAETAKIARHPFTRSSWTNPDGIRQLVSYAWFIGYHVLLKALWRVVTVTLQLLLVALLFFVSYSYLSWQGIIAWSYFADLPPFSWGLWLWNLIYGKCVLGLWHFVADLIPWIWGWLWYLTYHKCVLGSWHLVVTYIPWLWEWLW